MGRLFVHFIFGIIQARFYVMLQIFAQYLKLAPRSAVNSGFFVNVHCFLQAVIFTFPAFVMGTGPLFVKNIFVAFYQLDRIFTGFFQPMPKFMSFKKDFGPAIIQQARATGFYFYYGTYYSLLHNIALL